MEIRVGNTRYHVRFRIIVKCQILDRASFVIKTELAQGEAVCRPQDVFNQREGQLRAFNKAMRGMRTHWKPEVRQQFSTKEDRRAIWGQFLAWLEGRPKPVPQVKAKSGPHPALEPLEEFRDAIQSIPEKIIMPAPITPDVPGDDIPF